MELGFDKGGGERRGGRGSGELIMVKNSVYGVSFALGVGEVALTGPATCHGQAGEAAPLAPQQMQQRYRQRRTSLV